MPFNIRTTLSSPSDGEFVLSAFDAALPHLASIGSCEQWGSDPLSANPERCARVHAWITASESYRRTGSGEPVRAFIAEARLPSLSPSLFDKELETRTDGEGREWISVAAAVVKEGYFPAYVAEQPQFEELVKEEREKDGSVYLEAMISDFRTGELRKGSGVAMLVAVKSYAATRKARVLFVDCWAGNDGKLVRLVLLPFLSFRGEVRKGGKRELTEVGSMRRWASCGLVSLRFRGRRRRLGQECS
jgi:hypothetical protein